MYVIAEKKSNRRTYNATNSTDSYSSNTLICYLDTTSINSRIYRSQSTSRCLTTNTALHAHKQSSIPNGWSTATLKQKNQTNLPERAFRRRPRQPADEHLGAFRRPAICSQSHTTHEKSRDTRRKTLLSK